jgi:tripartite-type tricarboxylate transporter receptor subunit TctC
MMRWAEGRMRTKALALLAIAAAFSAVSAPSAAQQWPTKPVRIIVPYPPGGGTDIQARLLSAAFQKSMGHNFLIDNRTGASGLIGTQIAVDSPPDGDTILFVSGSISVVVTLFAKHTKFDIFNDLTPISWISSTPLVLTVHPSIPAKTVPQLIALAKKHPGGMNATGNAAGTTAHLSGEMLNQIAGLKTTILTYRGAGPAVIALISGEAVYGFTTAPSIMPHLKSGKARGLAVTTPKRSSVLPDLPTMNTFYPAFEVDNWYAMFYQKGTPRPIIDKMNAEIKKALTTPEVKAFYAKEALDAIASSPEDLSALVKREVPKYAKIIQRAGIKVQ